MRRGEERKGWVERNGLKRRKEREGRRKDCWISESDGRWTMLELKSYYQVRNRNPKSRERGRSHPHHFSVKRKGERIRREKDGGWEGGIESPFSSYSHFSMFSPDDGSCWWYIHACMQVSFSFSFFLGEGMKYNSFSNIKHEFIRDFGSFTLSLSLSFFISVTLKRGTKIDPQVHHLHSHVCIKLYLPLFNFSKSFQRFKVENLLLLLLPF